MSVRVGPILESLELGDPEKLVPSVRVWPDASDARNSSVKDNVVIVFMSGALLRFRYVHRMHNKGRIRRDGRHAEEKRGGAPRKKAGMTDPTPNARPCVRDASMNFKLPPLRSVKSAVTPVRRS